MAEEIEIKNVGGKKGVASEATLIRLQETMSAMARQMGAANNQNSRVQDAYIKSLKDSKKSYEENTTEVNENTDAVSASTSAFRSIGGMLGGALMSGISSVAGSMFGLGKELLIGGNNLSDFTQHIPLVGGALTGVVGVLEGMHSTLQTLSSQGAAFNNSLLEMNVSALEAGMGLTAYTTFIEENTDRLRLFGGSVTEGAQAFGKLSREFRTSNIGAQFLSMGFTINELNEGLLNFAQLEGRVSGQRVKVDQSLMQGSAEYLDQLDRLAKLTGQRREQMAAQMAQASVDANVAAQMAGMSREQRIAFQSNIAYITDQLGPEFGNAFKDLTDGIPQTPLGEILYSQFQPFARLAENAENMSLDEVNDAIRAMGPDMVRFRNSLGGEGVSALGDADAGFQSFFSSLFRITDFLALSEADLETIEEERRKRELLATALGNFSTKIDDIRTTILLKFFEEGGVGSRIQSFLDSITTEDIDSFNTKLNRFLDAFSADPSRAIGDLYNNIMDYLFGAVESGGPGNMYERRVGGVLEPMMQSIKDSLVNGFTSLFENPELRQALERGLVNMLNFLNESSTLLDYMIDDDKLREMNENVNMTEQQRIDRDIANLQPNFNSLSSSDQWAQYAPEEYQTLIQETQALIDSIRERGGDVVIPEGVTEVRRVGTLRATGRLTEPKNTIAQIHAGERVLNPQEAAEYNAESSVSNDVTTVASAMSNSQNEISSGLNMLNNNMSRLVALISENNRLTKRTASAIAETGNLQG